MLTKKKLLSLLLALVMVFSLLPTVAILAAAASPNSTASTALVLPVNGSISGEGYGTNTRLPLIFRRKAANTKTSSTTQRIRRSRLLLIQRLLET